MSGGKIGVPTSRGPLERPQDVFGCKKAFFRKFVFSLCKVKVFEGRVVLRPPPRAIWTDVRSCYPWGTPLPHSTKNKKIIFFLVSSLFAVFSALCLFCWSRERSHLGAAWPRKGLAPHVGPSRRPHLDSMSGVTHSTNDFFSLVAAVFTFSSSLCTRFSFSSVFSLLTSLCP